MSARQPAVALSDLAWALDCEEFSVRLRAHREGWIWYPAVADGGEREEPHYFLDGLPPVVARAVLDRLAVSAGRPELELSALAGAEKKGA